MDSYIMPNFYTYFISSLPMLHFGIKPPFSYDKFLQMCVEFIPASDVQILKSLPPKHPLINKWLIFDTVLRNELVKLRAQRRHADTAKYLRPDGYSGSLIVHLALAAQRNPHPIDAEKFLDQQRWEMLDDLAIGQFFNLEWLIVYAYKLKILERWELIRTADKAALLEGTLLTQKIS